MMSRTQFTEVLHLHGSLFAPRCDICGRPHEFAQAPPDQPLLEIEPPPCSRCSGRLRPGVVWFGEQLPQGVLTQAAQAILACDLLLIVGTSGVVQPVAGLVDLAPEHATIIEINPEPSARRRAALLQVRGTAAGVLPDVRDALLRCRINLSTSTSDTET